MVSHRGNDFSSQASYLVIVLTVAIIFAFSAKPTVAQNRRKVAPPREMVQQLMRDDEGVRSLIQDESYKVAKLANELEAETVDLNRDGKPEWVLQPGFEMRMCGATGNCANWVYRKTKNGYQLLLSTEGGRLKISKSITNGYVDLTNEGYFGASTTSISTYKFDGRQYQFKDCVIRDYLDKNGRQMKRPRFRKCQEEE